MTPAFYIIDPSGDISIQATLEDALSYIEPADATETILFDATGKRYPLGVIRRRQRFLGLFPVLVDAVSITGIPADQCSEIEVRLKQFACSLGLVGIDHLEFPELLEAIASKTATDHD